MPEFRNVFVCGECGYTSAKWLGKCPSCSAWNSFTEDAVTNAAFKEIEKATPLVPQKVMDQKPAKHLATGMSEVDLVLGGGLADGALTLLAGAPGIGKSTLTLQIAGKMSGKTLLVSAEESGGQVSTRAKRLGIMKEDLEIVSETDLGTILATLHKHKPAVAIIDSVQTIYAAEASGFAGSPSQTKFIAERLLKFAHENGVAVLLIGHVTKEGEIAGPRTLEHLVDAVFMLEGERHQTHRILRGIKNRFGATDEIGVLEMTESGMKEIKNPSEFFLSGRQAGSLGSAVTAATEGARTFLVEIQALTISSSYGYPKRTSSGLALNRLDILIAVLQKYAGLKLQNDDVFLNVAGGFRLEERAGDLAAALAIASSKLKRALPEGVLALGEVGLSGELRPVPLTQKRVKEAEKLGYTEIVLPKGEEIKSKAKLVRCETLKEALQKILR